MSLYIYLGCMVFGVLFFGAIHTWVYTIVFLGVMATSLLLLGDDVTAERDSLYLNWVKTDLTPLFTFFFGYLILQITSLPQGLITEASPTAGIAADMSQPASTIFDRVDLSGAWYTLAPYTHPVRMSLIRWTVYGIFFFGLIRCLDSRKKIETASVTILLLCCFDALYGIIQTYSGSNHVWWFKDRVHSRSVIGTYLNRNHFAGLMEMGIALAVAYAAALGGKSAGPHESSNRRRSLKKRFLELFSERGKNIRRFLVVFAGVIMGLGLILSASRGAIIAAAGALLVMGLLFSLRKSERRKGRIILALFTLTLLYGLFTGMDYTVERFQFFDPDLLNRWVMTGKAVELFRDYPIVGVGVGNFRYAYGKYQSPVHNNLYVDYAHNDYAQFLAEAGVIGGILLIAGTGWYLVRTFRRWRQRSDPFAVGLGVAPFGALVAISIHSISDYNLHRPANMLVLIAVIAIGYAALHIERHHHRSPVHYRKRLIPLRPWGGILLAGIAGAILWSGVWTVRHFIAEGYCNSEINITLNRKETPSAAEARAAMGWNPGNATYPFKRARALADGRDRHMLGPTPDREGWTGSHEPIIAALEQSIRLNPLNADTHVRLAWEYSYLFERPDYRSRWLPLADICLARAEWAAGDWAQNPRLQYDMGNYLTMRIETLAPKDPQRAPNWTRADWHYRRGMMLEKRSRLPEDVRGYLEAFYLHEAALYQPLLLYPSRAVKGRELIFENLK
ncbi:MAG: O-antigen ligase family protein [Syntrophales bacterium]